MKYKNLTDQPLVIPNIGEVEPNGIIETDQVIENPHLQPLVGEGAPTPQPQAPVPPIPEEPKHLDDVEGNVKMTEGVTN